MTRSLSNGGKKHKENSGFDGIRQNWTKRTPVTN